MRRILTVILWLTLIPVAFASTIEDPTKLTIPSNFEQCDNLKPLYADAAPRPEAAFLESTIGSLTGFADFSHTDGFLRFIDEYVVSNLQHFGLRSTLQSHMPIDIADIEGQLISFYGQFSLE